VVRAVLGSPRHARGCGPRASAPRKPGPRSRACRRVAGA
jgi:hypothetical protein